MSTTTTRHLPPDPRTVAEMIPVREAEIARRGESPLCPASPDSHGVMQPRPLGQQTYEQMWCGVWYDCQRCTSSVSYASRELAAYRGEPYNTGSGYELWDGTAWQPISDAEKERLWNERKAAKDRRDAEMMAAARRKPVVTYDGKTYTVRSRKTEIPDLAAMDRTAALIWLNQNTYATGRGTRTRRDVLAGMGGAVSVTIR